MTTISNISLQLNGVTGTGKFVGSNSPTFTANPIIPSPFILSATSVTSTGTQLNYLSSLSRVVINKLNVQVFTTIGAGTYTPTSGMVYCTCEVLGGGGAGGGAAGNGTGYAGGAGGSAGCYVISTVPASSIGSSKSITVGAGGTPGTAGNVAGGAGSATLITGIIQGNGGPGGSGAAASTSVGRSGNSGAASTGTKTTGQGFVSDGIPGNFGVCLGLTLGYSGSGANSLYGAGAQIVTGTNAGSSSTNYGAGGSGGSANTSANVSGGPGSQGIIIITEYISA